MADNVQNRIAIVAVLTLILISDNYAVKNNGKGSVDVFNLLLGLYKLNPMTGSKVYKDFYKNMITKNKKIIPSLHLDTTESNDNVTDDLASKIGEIERIVHTIHKKKQYNGFLQTPEYDVENLNSENFNIEFSVPHNPLEKTEEVTGDVSTNNNKSIEQENYSTYINNNDINESRSMFTTKLSQLNNITGGEQIRQAKFRNIIRKIKKELNAVTQSPVVRVSNDIQGTSSMNTNLVTADVIVL